MATATKTFPLTSTMITLLAPNLYYIEGERGSICTWVITSNSVSDGWAQQNGVGSAFDVNEHIPKSRFKRKVMGYKIQIDLSEVSQYDLRRLAVIKPAIFTKITKTTGYVPTSNPNLFTDHASMSYHVVV